MTLDELFKREGADKQTGMHGYAPVYEELFSPWKWFPVRLLEIGVYQGASIRAWLEYFPNGLINGIDLSPWPHAVRYNHWTGDQTDKEFLKGVIAKVGPFSIIIDDGSHKVKDQLASFEVLWPALAHGGYYVIEDTQCWWDAEQSKDYNNVDTGSFFYDLLTAINWHGRDYIGRPSGKGAVPQSDYQFDSLRIHKGLVIIRKTP